MKPRWIGYRHAANCYQPVQQPDPALEKVELSVDEIEALRLADVLGLSQEQGATEMNVSRQTFGRIVEAARKKTAHALVNGMVLCIQIDADGRHYPPGPYRRQHRHGHGHSR
jgi:predicted DNA-binding protein (UPF0251 family)